MLIQVISWPVTRCSSSSIRTSSLPSCHEWCWSVLRMLLIFECWSIFCRFSVLCLILHLFLNSWWNKKQRHYHLNHSKYECLALCSCLQSSQFRVKELIFQYAFAASRLPGAAPDRYVESEGDADGVIRGSYAYLDPNYQWRQVGRTLYLHGQ